MHLLAADTSSGPPWLSIVLATIGLLGTVGTIVGGVVVERIKQRQQRPAEGDSKQKPKKPLTPTTDGAVDLVGDLVDDLQERCAVLDRDLKSEIRDSAAKDVTIALLRAQVEALTAERNRLVDRLGRSA